jgi:hypothetical protein
MSPVYGYLYCYTESVIFFCHDFIELVSHAFSLYAIFFFHSMSSYVYFFSMFQSFCMFQWFVFIFCDCLCVLIPQSFPDIFPSVWSCMLITLPTVVLWGFHFEHFCWVTFHNFCFFLNFSPMLFTFFSRSWTDFLT